MKKRIITIAAIAIAMVLLVAIGCLILHNTSPAATTTPAKASITNAEEIYSRAVAVYEDTVAATLEITALQQLVTNNELLTEQTQKTLSYQGYNTETFTSSSEEVITIGDFTLNISETYSNGTAYTTVAGSSFRTSFTAEAFQNRIVPAALLDPTLYTDIYGWDNGSDYFLYFEKPIAPETWSIKNGWIFADAQGFAQISHDGGLLTSVYAVTYTYGSQTLHLTVYASPTEKEVVIQTPENTSDYRQITYFDGPRMLEKACGYLLHANNIAAEYSDLVFCQAFGDERSKNISLYTANSDTFSARIDTETILKNTGRVGDVTKHLHNELFLDGVYTIRVDEGEPTENTSLTEDALQTYCKDQLVSTIILPQDIVTAETTETEDSIKITFKLNDTFASQVSSNACQTLYQKPELLNELADKNTTQVLTSYLILDKYTALPLGSGIEYSGQYMIEGLPYQLQYKADQSYTVASTNTLQIISEAASQ